MRDKLLLKRILCVLLLLALFTGTVSAEEAGAIRDNLTGEPEYGETAESVQTEENGDDETVPALLSVGMAEDDVTVTPDGESETVVAETAEDKTEVPVTETEDEKTEIPVTETEDDETEVPVTETEDGKTEIPVTETEDEKTEIPVTETEDDETEVPVTETEDEKTEIPVTETEDDETEVPVTETKDDETEVPVIETPEDDTDTPVVVIEETHTITYVLNGGTNAEENPSFYTEGHALSLFAPRYPGYAFAGWFTDADFTTPFDGITAEMTQDVTVYAKWGTARYTVWFDGNGAVNTAKYKQYYTCGVSAALYANAYSISAYSFAGWNTESDGSGAAYENTESVKDLSLEDGAEVILYAQWVPTEYAITYKLSGGSRGENPAVYTVLDTVTFTEPDCEGYTFGGWFTDSKYKTRVTVIKAGTTGAKTVYGKLTANKYAVVFNGNGATNVASYKQTHTYGTAAALTANKYKRTGYTFLGWNTEPDGSGTNYKNSEKVKNLTAESGATVTLYAQWQLNTYKITYKLSGGTVGENPDTYTVLDAFTLADAECVGYTFKGWYSDNGYRTRVTAVKAGSTGNKTLYGKLTANKYTVVFDGNGAANVASYKQTHTYAATAALTANKFKRTGYTFLGWNTESDGSGTNYSNSQKVKNLTAESGAAVTLYAQWRLDSYKITYKLAGGTAGENPETYTVYDAVDFTDPDCPGYSFGGWYSDAKYTKKMTGIKAGTTGAKTVYGKLTGVKYAVVFDGNGATNVASYKQTHTYAATAALTANKFKRTGYTFLGWNTEPDGSGTSYSNSQKVKNLTTESGATVTLYAQWEVTKYKITYKLAGGTAGENPSTYTVYDEVTFTDPGCPGYSFGGWYSDAKYTKKVTAIKAGTTGAKTVYGKLTANKYAVVFDGNGAANVAPYKQTYTYGATAALTANKYKRTGYTFLGWSTESDGSGTNYKNSQKVKNLTTESGATVTLYAQWEVTKYKITYSMAGGNRGENPATYTAIDNVVFVEPDCEGYTFGGWYADAKYKKAVTQIPEGTTGNKTVYARLTAHRFAVQFDGNGASNVKPYRQVYTYNKAAALTANKFTRTGYTFTGWNTEPDGSGTAYKNKQSIKNLSAEDESIITFYAQWKVNSYNLTYKLNSGTNSPENPKTYTVNDSFTFAAPTRAGYTFLGWYKDSAFKKAAASMPAGTTGNQTLYAKWSVNKYAVVFNGNGADQSGTYSQTITCGTSTALTKNKFSLKGYTFMGWNTESDGSGTSYSNAQKVKNLSSENGAVINLYAVWRLDTYTLTYKLNGGSAGKANPAGYTVYDAVELESPTRRGYTFVGWYSDSAFKKSVSAKIAVGTTGNKTYYAKWTTNKYKIVYDGSGADQSSTYSQTFTYGTTAALTDVKFTKLGYTFIGWNTESDGSGYAYANKKKVTNVGSENGEAVTLYAQWQLNTYKITYTLNGGTVEGENPKTYNVHDDIELIAPTRPKYTFDGWYKDSAFKKPFAGIKPGTTGNLTLFARWHADRFTVLFYSNGGTPDSASQSVTIGKAAKLNSNPFTRKGYVFDGWNTEPDGSGTAFTNAQNITDYYTVDGMVLELYAQWRPTMISIIYRDLEYKVINTDVPVEEFVTFTDGKVCETGAGYGGRCLFVATYHCASLYRGMTTSMNSEDAYYGKHGSVHLQTRLFSTKSALLKELKKLLETGKPQVVMAEASYGGARHFVTVVGYKETAESSTGLKETDLLIIDSHDGKLESTDPEIFSEKTRHLYSQEGYYRIEALY